MRAPYNVLVLPFLRVGEETRYCIFKRKDLDVWQFLAGGGEGAERPQDAARRESGEEAGLSSAREYKPLESMCHVSVEHFARKVRAHWGDKYVIPVYSFAVELTSPTIRLSCEHTGYRWCSYEQAVKLLHFDLDRTALYELKERLRNHRL